MNDYYGHDKRNAMADTIVLLFLLLVALGLIGFLTWILLRH